MIMIMIMNIQDIKYEEQLEEQLDNYNRYLYGEDYDNRHK